LFKTYTDSVTSGLTKHYTMLASDMCTFHIYMVIVELQIDTI